MKTCTKVKEQKEPLAQLNTMLIGLTRLENKILKPQGKRLCTTCKDIFNISDMRGGYCVPCGRTKDANRRAKDGEKEKLSNNTKKWYENNKEEILARAKVRREANKEKIRLRLKKYREANKEIIKEKARIYRELNRDKKNESNKRWREKKKLEKLQALEAQNDNSI